MEVLRRLPQNWAQPDGIDQGLERLVEALDAYGEMIGEVDTMEGSRELIEELGRRGRAVRIRLGAAVEAGSDRSGVSRYAVSLSLS